MSIENPRTESVSTRSLIDSGWKLTPHFLDAAPLQIHGSSPVIEYLLGDGFDLVGFRLLTPMDCPSETDIVMETQLTNCLQSLDALTQQLQQAVPLNRSPELLTLAKRAVTAVSERRTENIDEWARSLIDDTKDAVD